MSNGLIMHLSGPFQSYGGPAQTNLRPTYRQPTRSALTGMIACCLGRERDADNTDLAQLSYTIRVDRPGTILADFHTVGGNHDSVFGLTTAEGKTRDAPIVSTRYYLNDAAFTLAVTGPTPILDLTAQALTHPVWAPYLGRRSCPPDTPSSSPAATTPSKTSTTSPSTAPPPTAPAPSPTSTTAPPPPPPPAAASSTTSPSPATTGHGPRGPSGNSSAPSPHPTAASEPPG
ncbi:CRISPR-associated protein cas5 family [Streptomyces laurentii]|uniref:CRISPR-associated protein cas5 family n=1 Tax=Streptomyces laurentii TaxID=39478 RepID=A0A160PA43_STRLU|nr:CRISPR-associated protein cas5 family [Streptomyces laurentii]